MKSYKTLAIIPARGGSKGIRRKNLQKLSGKPLIAHTIIAAKKTKSINKIIVSTDDKEIGKISKKCPKHPKMGRFGRPTCAFAAIGLGARLCQRRQQHAGQNADDGYHHQQFNQGKTLLVSIFHDFPLFFLGCAPYP